MTQDEPRKARFEELIRIEAEATEAAKAEKAKASAKAKVKAKEAKAKAEKAKAEKASEAKVEPARSRAEKAPDTVKTTQGVRADTGPDEPTSDGTIVAHDQKRSRVLKLRLTENELELVKTLAAERAVPAATLARSILLQSINRPGKT